MQSKILTPADLPLLETPAADLFDAPPQLVWSTEFLSDPRHHLAVAIDENMLVGFVSAVHYLHPDKPPELWINEVGVSTAYQQKGLASQLMQLMFAHGLKLGCQTAWVLTDEDNLAANHLYHKVGGSPEACVLYSFNLTDEH